MDQSLGSRLIMGFHQRLLWITTAALRFDPNDRRVAACLRGLVPSLSLSVSSACPWPRCQLSDTARAEVQVRSRMSSLSAAYYCAHIQLLSRKLSRARCLHVLHRCLQASTPFYGVAYRPVDIFPQNVRSSPSRLSTPVERAAVSLTCLFGLRTRIRWPP